MTGLVDLGIVTRGAGADNVRNITASPTAGVDPQELIDVRPLVKQLHHHILNHRELYGLPRKFNIAFDSGGVISTLEDTNDIGFAAVRLAAYKVPRRVVLVDELPKGSAGKVKRLGLASALGLVAGSPHMPTSRPGFVAPRTPVEEMVAAFWAEVLGLAEVGVDDDFLELGGDSVLASLVAARLSRALRLEISVATFFEAPTVVAMALAVEDLLLGDAERQLVDEVGSNAV